MWQKSVFILTNILLICIAFSNCKPSKDVIVLTEDTWSELLEGEWLVEFYAPWCPACKSLESTWTKVATWQDDLEIKVAIIDVSAHPSLSGRFLVTALPTIYHVKDGEFRQYKGARDEDTIISFVDDKKYKEVSAVPWYYSPKSAHMAAMGWFFKASLAIRDLHNQMTSEYGIPVWGSYIIFAILTIILGLILGLCIVCACDYFFPPQPLPREPTRYTAAHPDGQYRVHQAINPDDETQEEFLEEPTSAEGGEEEPSSVRRRPQKTN